MIELTAVEQRYNDILLNNMAGVAVVNQHLKVSAIEFRSVGEEQIGVLITPWFMNLLLLPDDKTLWGEELQGSTICRTYPSGKYEFIHGWDPQMGGYAMCSLFSPMFEFSDQQQAEETAAEVMNALFDRDNYAPTDRQRENETARVKAESQMTENTPEGSHSNAGEIEEEAQPEAKTSAELSRRQFLTGMRSARVDKHV